MDRAELSLLLYIETCAVDRSGKLDAQRMNAEDLAILKRWNAKGFVSSGRICAADTFRGESMWCVLSPEAFAAAHAERRVRAERLWSKRTFKTTQEKRNEPSDKRWGYDTEEGESGDAE